MAHAAVMSNHQRPGVRPRLGSSEQRRAPPPPGVRRGRAGPAGAGVGGAGVRGGTACAARSGRGARAGGSGAWHVLSGRRKAHRARGAGKTLVDPRVPVGDRESGHVTGRPGPPGVRHREHACRRRTPPDPWRPGSGGGPVHPPSRRAAHPVPRPGLGPTHHGDAMTAGIGRSVYPGMPNRPYPAKRWDGWSWTPRRGGPLPALESGLNPALPYPFTAEAALPYPRSRRAAPPLRLVFGRPQ